MNKDQKARQRFVDRRLQPLMQAASANEVSACDFIIVDKGERVRVRFRNGLAINVNVDGMTLAELSRACLKAII